MANLTETSRWEAGIYQFETSDPVMGGPNGIDNRPTRELANRTLWLKTELAKALESIGSNKTAADSALATKAAATTQMIAGNGLTGGGTLAANRTLTLGTPSSITASSTNSVTTTSHTHAIDQASTSTAGIVQLSTATNSTATNMAATPSAVKAAYDLAKSTSTDAVMTSGDQNITGIKKFTGDLVSTYRLAINRGDQGYQPYITLTDSSINLETLSSRKAIGQIDFNVPSGASSELAAQIKAAVESNKTAAFEFLLRSESGNSVYKLNAKTPGTYNLVTSADQASTSTAGIVQLSTATNSTATNMAATPSAVKAAYDLAARKADLSDFASLRAGNGYQKLPNGLILQWGSVVVGVDSAVNITFPVAFPTAVLNVQSTVNGGGAIGGTVVLSSHVGSLSATGITVAMTEDGVPGAKPVYWFAIGY